MKLKLNDKVTWKDKYGRILPGIVTSLDKFTNCVDVDLNGCIQLSAPSFLPYSTKWNNVIIDSFHVITIENYLKIIHLLFGSLGFISYIRYVSLR